MSMESSQPMDQPAWAPVTLDGMAYSRLGASFAVTRETNGPGNHEICGGRNPLIKQRRKTGNVFA